MSTISIDGSAPVGNKDDPAYESFLKRVDARFRSFVGDKPVFETDAEGLFEAYLDTFPPGDRQHYNCHSCRRFITRYGGLVAITPSGRKVSVIWNPEDASTEELAAVKVLEKMVLGAKVVGPFVASEKVWGEPITGSWRHLAVRPPETLIHKSKILDAGQAMAEKREDFKNVQRALGEFPEQVVKQALTLLNTESLYRSEKVLGAAQWLADLHLARAAVRSREAKDNVTWGAVATAPAGFCHPRSSMIGTLLEDLAAGMDFTAVAQRFAKKMNPLQYQRPQAAPSAGAIIHAEKLVQELGIARSLPRRYAELRDLETYWSPKEPEPQLGGVFGHLAPRRAAGLPPPITLKNQTMTWDKFSRTILPGAEEIEIYAKHGSDAYAQLVTALDPDAPPILQWDHDHLRNPVSWYFWASGSPASQFGLTPGQFHAVTAITLQPSMWRALANPHQGKGVMFVMKGAKDTRNCGGALFPEILKSELHPVRSVIEAYSKQAKLHGGEHGVAAGIMVKSGAPWEVVLRVKGGNSVGQYTLDRWD